MLRVETTINNPRAAGDKLHKPIGKIKGYYWYGIQCNDRFLDVLAQVYVTQLNNECEY